MTGIGSRSGTASTEVVPTWLAAGQLPAWNWLSVHFVVALGLPSRPGGRWTVRSLRSSSPESPMSIATSGWLEAWVALPAPGFGFDGVSERLVMLAACALVAPKSATSSTTRVPSPTR